MKHAFYFLEMYVCVCHFHCVSYKEHWLWDISLTVCVIRTFEINTLLWKDKRKGWLTRRKKFLSHFLFHLGPRPRWVSLKSETIIVLPHALGHSPENSFLLTKHHCATKSYDYVTFGVLCVRITNTAHLLYIWSLWWG